MEEKQMPFTEFKPICLNHYNGRTSEGYAHTSTGHLVPCCHVDYTNNVDPLYLDLLKEELKLENNESVEDILLTDEWIAFAEAVIKGYTENLEHAPACCLHKCGVRGE